MLVIVTRDDTWQDNGNFNVWLTNAPSVEVGIEQVRDELPDYAQSSHLTGWPAVKCSPGQVIDISDGKTP